VETFVKRVRMVTSQPECGLILNSVSYTWSEKILCGTSHQCFTKEINIVSSSLLRNWDAGKWQY